MKPVFLILGIGFLVFGLVGGGPGGLPFTPLPLWRSDVQISAYFAAYRHNGGTVFAIHSAGGAIPRPGGRFAIYRIIMDIRLQDMVFGNCRMYVHWYSFWYPHHIEPTSTCN